MSDVVIVGSGVAGHSAANELRRLAPTKRIQVIGTEPGRPYDRTELSKGSFLGANAGRALLPGSEIYDSGVMLRDGIAVVGIDRANKVVRLSDGSEEPFDRLLLATGSREKRLDLPKVDAGRIHYFRTFEQAANLRAALREVPRVVVVGGGLLGLEVAAAARAGGCAVTVLEAAQALMARTATPVLAAYMRQLHLDGGSDIALGAEVDGGGDDQGGATLTWEGGEAHSDILVVVIGVAPNVELPSDAGLQIDDGLLVDHHACTSDASIYAAGEVTNYPLGNSDLRLRSQSWNAAAAQAVVAARNILGVECTFNELPWSWSEQFGTNVQCLGVPTQASRFLQIGDPASSSWLRIGLDANGGLVGAESVNAGREMSALRRAATKGLPIPAFLVEQSTTHDAETQDDGFAG